MGIRNTKRTSVCPQGSSKVQERERDKLIVVGEQGLRGRVQAGEVLGTRVLGQAADVWG